MAKPGTAFAPGDLIVELETHKAVVEARAGQAGILREIKAAPGDWCRIGTPLGPVQRQRRRGDCPTAPAARPTS